MKGETGSGMASRQGHQRKSPDYSVDLSVAARNFFLSRQFGLI